MESLVLKKDKLKIYGVCALGIILLFSLSALIRDNNASTAFVIDEEERHFEIRGSPAIGNFDAPVTIVLFSDFSCPFCAAAAGNKEMVQYMKSRDASWEPAVPGILEDYVKTGKAKLVFKYFPGHGSGQAAHLVAWCLDEQDLFWKFHDKAFEEYEDTGEIDRMKDLAESLDADMKKLEDCLELERHEQRFNEGYIEAEELGIKGTPSFVINGKTIRGACSHETFEKAIDAEIAGKSWNASGCMIIY